MVLLSMPFNWLRPCGHALHYVICTSHQAYGASHRARKTWQTLWWPIVDPEFIRALTPWLPPSSNFVGCPSIDAIAPYTTLAINERLWIGCNIGSPAPGKWDILLVLALVRAFAIFLAMPLHHVDHTTRNDKLNQHHGDRQKIRPKLEIKAWNKVVSLTNKCRILLLFCYDCEASWRYEWVSSGSSIYSSVAWCSSYNTDKRNSVSLGGIWALGSCSHRL